MASKTKQPAARTRARAADRLEGSRAKARNAEPQMQKEPKPPFPKQKLRGVGIESKLKPRPRYEAPRYRPAGKLEGKCALITGGDSGIGRAVAVLYAREGADVAISYLPEEQSDAEETLRAVEAEGRRCVLIPGDLSEPRFCEDLIEQAVNELGKLDVLVSNAAHQNRKETLDDLTDEELKTTFDINILAYIRLCRAALRHMKAGASIIATSSVTGLTARKSCLTIPRRKAQSTRLPKRSRRTCSRKASALTRSRPARSGRRSIPPTTE